MGLKLNKNQKEAISVLRPRWNLYHLGRYRAVAEGSKLPPS